MGKLSSELEGSSVPFLKGKEKLRSLKGGEGREQRDRPYICRNPLVSSGSQLSGWWVLSREKHDKPPHPGLLLWAPTPDS